MKIDQEIFSEEPRPNRRPFKAFFAFELPLRVSEPSDVSWRERRETTWGGVKKDALKTRKWKRDSLRDDLVCFNKNAEETQKVHEVKTQTVLLV